jgi:hypothetical protein
VDNPNGGQNGGQTIAKLIKTRAQIQAAYCFGIAATKETSVLSVIKALLPRTRLIGTSRSIGSTDAPSRSGDRFPRTREG